MKYTKLAFLSTLLLSSIIKPLDDYTNQSYMFIRPVFDSVSIQQASWHDIAFCKQETGSAFQVYSIYQQSFENLNNPAYFLFDHKTSLTIQAGTVSAFENPTITPKILNPKQDQINVQSYNRDILGQWVGINNGPAATFTLKPSQKQACAMIEFSQDMNKITSMSLFENWFINLAVPITWVENNIGISGDQKALDAMNQNSFNFVRMTPGDQHSIRLTQANLSLGTRYIGEPDVHIITTTGVMIPLVEQNGNESLFQPVQGFNAHFGFDTHALFQFPVCQKHEYSNSKILFFLDLHNNFLTRNHQLRTFDIKNKPFSRYMKLLDSYTNSLVPAMNALTIRARVEPFISTNVATGFRLKFKNSIIETGYELWAHGNERVTPEQKAGVYDGCGVWYEDRYGIPFINTDGVLAKINSTTGNVETLAANDTGITASDSTINYIGLPDGETSCCITEKFVQKNKYLKLKDLDKSSCAARSTITHKGFVSVGFGSKGETRDCFANFGCYLQAAQNNASLCFWGAWFKAGLTF